MGAAYVLAAYDALKNWLAALPAEEPIALAFSGGIDSTSVLLLARHALQELGQNTGRLRAFTLDLGGGKDAVQAESDCRRDLGLETQWEVIRVPADAAGSGRGHPGHRGLSSAGRGVRRGRAVPA